MAVNKNFTVRNGLEVNTKLILADANSNKVGIGSTGPRFELDVAGGIGATNIYVSGVSTSLETFNVGSGGRVLSVIAGPNGIGTSKVGIGTSNPQYLLEVRSPISTGQTALYVHGDMRITGDLNIDDVVLDDALIQNLTITEALNINSPGISTFGGYVNISSNLNVGGIGTITTLNSTNGTINTLSGTNLNYSGIGTLETLALGTQTNKATISYTTNTARTLTIPNIDGNRTFAFIDQNQTFTETQNFSSVNVTGITTLGNIQISSGIVTSTSGIVTFYGDGSGLINTPPGSPAGSISQVQYNNGVSFAGSPNLTHDGTTTRITSGIVTTISGTNLNYSGGTITTLNSTNGTINTLSGTNLNYSGVGTIFRIFGTNLNYSGVGTIATLNSTTGIVTTISGTNLNYSGIGTIFRIFGTNLNYSGVGTITTLNSTNGTINTLSGTNLNYSGIVTASSFVVNGGLSSQFLKADGSVDSSNYSSTGKAIAMAIVFG